MYQSKPYQLRIQCYLNYELAIPIEISIKKPKAKMKTHIVAVGAEISKRSI